MRIEDKPTTIEDAQGGTLTYKDLLLAVARKVEKEGMDYEVMAKRCDLIQAITSSNGVIELDEEQTVELRTVWKNHRWPMPHEDLLELNRLVKKEET